MLSLAIVYGIYLFFTKLVLFTQFMIWYLIIVKLLNTYFNFLIIWSIILIWNHNRVFYFTLFYLFVNFNLDVSFCSVFSIIPKQLLSGYNNIHPSFFYSGFIFFYLYFKSWDLGYFFRGLFILTFLAIALSLGGLWGAGNSIWGFFWVNDSIEIILFILCIFLIFVIHSETTQYNLFFIKILTILIILWLLLLRWGFTFTRHNFFDLKKLVNIGVVFIFFFTISGVLSLIYFLFIIFGSYYFVAIFLTRIFSVCFKKINKYNNYLVILHIAIFCITLSWLKFRQNNVIVFIESLWFNSFIISNKVTSLSLYNQLFFFKPSLYKILNNYYMFFFGYCFKTHFFIHVYISYHIVWTLVSVLFFFKK